MKIEVNVSKRYFFTILASVLIVVGIIAGYALTISPGAVPSPGHALSSIQGFFQGDANLQVSLAKFSNGEGILIPDPNSPDTYINLTDLTQNFDYYVSSTSSFSSSDLNCSSAPLVDTTTLGRYNATGEFGLHKVDISGTSCASTAGCVIKQEIWRHYANKTAAWDKMALSRTINYNQNPSSGLWTSTTNTLGNTKNGDTVATKIFPGYYCLISVNPTNGQVCSTANGVPGTYCSADSTTRFGSPCTSWSSCTCSAYAISLADDVKYKTFAENDSSHWVVKDDSKVLGQKIYICNYNTGSSDSVV